MKKARQTFLLLLCVLCLSGVFGNRADAASFNLIKVVTAKGRPAGRLIKDSKGYRFIYKSSGTYAKNEWMKIRKSIYYFGKDGYNVRGLKKYKGKFYYLKGRGVLGSGWKTVNGKKRYFSPKNGAAVTGWKTVDGKRYYFGRLGAMQTSRWIGDYYVGADGVMLRNTYVDGYYVDEDGARTTVNLEDDGPLAGPGEEQPQGSGYIFVGDSRMVGMMNTVGGDNIYIGKEGEGYRWFSETGKKELKKMLKQNPGGRVILNLGVNDMGNINQYLELYRALIVRYPQAKFYFLSVNPVEEKLAKTHGYNTSYVNNKNIQAFNAALKAAFPASYLDSYNYLISQNLIRNIKAGCGTVDGIHYTAAVNRAIFNFVSMNVQ